MEKKIEEKKEEEKKVAAEMSGLFDIFFRTVASCSTFVSFFAFTFVINKIILRTDTQHQKEKQHEYRKIDCFANFTFLC